MYDITENMGTKKKKIRKRKVFPRYKDVEL